jgi:hypothetical protein
MQESKIGGAKWLNITIIKSKVMWNRLLPMN